MVGEFFSGGVCQKENGENCSTEAVMDGRLTKVKLCACVGCVTGLQGQRGLLSLNPRVCAYMFLEIPKCVSKLVCMCEYVNVFMSPQTTQPEEIRPTELQV